jgi:hypothetical protein
MTPTLAAKSRNPGSSLIEAVIAVGVLAVAIPLVFGALAESGKSSMASEAETRSTWVVPICMEEIEASRDGKPLHFTASSAGEPFPSAGGVWALAFSAEGTLAGKVSKAAYNSGTKEIDGKPVRYIASLSSTAMPVKAGATPMLLARISLEFPSTAPAAKRQKLDFYTHIP